MKSTGGQVTILSYGYKLPADPDTGDVWFPALAFDITRLNSHSHNGTDSAPLSSTTQSILAAAWVAAPIGGGLYRQLVTLPGTLQYDTIEMWFKLSSGEYVYPSVERASANTYYIYTNNNTLQYTASYR